MSETEMTEQHDVDREPAPNPEVPARAIRRSFPASYKLEILERADRCIGEGEIGKLLRKEGLYSSHLSAWRKQRERGALQALGNKRGRKAKPVDPEKVRLERENAQLRRKLAQAEQIIEIQKKLSSLLGVAPSSNENNGES